MSKENDGSSVTGCRPGPSFLAVLALLIGLCGPMLASAVEPSLRERALQVGRHMITTAGHRMVSPVRLEVVNDSSDALLGGFTEALTEAGFTAQLSELTGTSGTVLLVRRMGGASDESSGLDVRVEHWPERSVVYSRLWLSGTEGSDPEVDGILERFLVPVTIGAAAALVVYLFFTVRS